MTLILQNQKVGPVESPDFAKSGKLSVKQPHEAYRLNCIGVPGQGKSVYRFFFLSPIYRVTLYNPLEDFNVGEIINVNEYRARMGEFRKGALRVTVAPMEYDYQSRRDEYDALCAYVYEVGAMHFCTEEIALVCKPNDVPGNLEMLYIKGRHRAVSLSAFGQRFHQFPVIVRGTSTEIVAFRQTDPIDVEDFDKRIYPAISPVPLNELPEHHFINWTAEGGAKLCSPLPYKERKKAEFQTRTGDLVSFDFFK